MTERKNLSKFLKLIKDNKPPDMPLYIYKDKDTFGGHKKPCDVWFIYQGRAICVEFKNAGYDRESETFKNQMAELQAISDAGACCWVAVFDGLYVYFTAVHRECAFFTPFKRVSDGDGVLILFSELVR